MDREVAEGDWGDREEGRRLVTGRAGGRGRVGESDLVRSRHQPVRS